MGREGSEAKAIHISTGRVWLQGRGVAPPNVAKCFGLSKRPEPSGINAKYQRGRSGAVRAQTISAGWISGRQAWTRSMTHGPAKQTSEGCANSGGTLVWSAVNRSLHVAFDPPQNHCSNGSGGVTSP